MTLTTKTKRVKSISAIVLSTALLGTFTSSTALADNIDQEIAKLKKENELLELQKQNEELKKAKKTESKGAVNKNGLFGFCKGEYANTGCFIGVEVGYVSGVENYLKVTSTESTTESTYALPISAVFGWQWYFYERMGLNFKGHFGYANYNSDLTIDGITGKFSSSALHYGLEVSYMYNLISSQKHTFGLNTGMGFEFGTFLGLNIKADGGKVDFDSYTKSSFVTTLGVHYYLNTNHQFWLSYKFKSGYMLGDGGKTNKDNFEYSYSTSPKDAIFFTYAYKF